MSAAGPGSSHCDACSAHGPTTSLGTSCLPRSPPLPLLLFYLPISFRSRGCLCSPPPSLPSFRRPTPPPPRPRRFPRHRSRANPQLLRRAPTSSLIYGCACLHCSSYGMDYASPEAASVLMPGASSISVSISTAYAQTVRLTGSTSFQWYTVVATATRVGQVVDWRTRSHLMQEMERASCFLSSLLRAFPPFPSHSQSWTRLFLFFYFSTAAMTNAHISSLLP